MADANDVLSMPTNQKLVGNLFGSVFV